MNQTSLFPLLLFAYRSHHSTEDALSCAINRWQCGLEERNVVGVLFLDMSKAFDRIRHESMSPSWMIFSNAASEAQPCPGLQTICPTDTSRLNISKLVRPLLPSHTQEEFHKDRCWDLSSSRYTQERYQHV